MEKNNTMKKQTKAERKEAVKTIGKIVSWLEKTIQVEKTKFIKEMITLMFAQARIMDKAKQKGIDIEKIMPELKKEYIKQKATLKE